MKDYYRILELGFPSTPAEIQSAYRRLAKKHHPDKGGSEEHMKELNEAYSTLSNPVKKAAYDSRYETERARRASAKQGSYTKQGYAYQQENASKQSYSSRQENASKQEYSYQQGNASKQSYSSRQENASKQEYQKPKAGQEAPKASAKKSRIGSLGHKILDLVGVIPHWGYVAACITLVVVLLGVKAVESIQTISLRSIAERAMEVSEEDLLEGLYSVKSLNGSGVSYYTAELQREGRDGCLITVYSDFEPLRLRGTVGSAGRLNCELLGEGMVVYKPSTGTITIRFNNQEADTICEFSK